MGVRRAIRGLVVLALALGYAAPAARASLGVPTGGPAIPYTSLSAFEAAAGGNFRHSDWDTLAVDGSDPGSTAIEAGHVATVARDRLEPWGIELGPQIAVSNDGFHSANSQVSFTPFSPPNVWAPFNSNTAELDVVAPAPTGSSPAPEQTRGVGVELLHVTSPGTSIEYLNGQIPLLTQSVPSGDTFAGALFPDSVVTRVLVTMGTAPIFSFDGSHATPTASATDFVAGDDVALAEPAPARAAVAGTAGVPVTAALDTFTESNPSATPQARIDWGDGTTTTGTIGPGSAGTFVVGGDHAYATAGTYTAQVTVDDGAGPEQSTQTTIQVEPRDTTTSLACSPGAVAVSAVTTCTVIVSDADAGARTAPSGVVTFSSPSAGAAFPGAGSCILGSSTTPGSSLCLVQFEPAQLPPFQARIVAAYEGDGTHAGSTVTGTVGVHPQRCTLQALAHRLRPAGLGVLVTCDAHSGVRISGRAVVARRGRARAFQLEFGSVGASVTAGRPTVLIIKPAPGVLPALRRALRRHQHITLKLTLTASSHATTKTTTTRVSALRLY